MIQLEKHNSPVYKAAITDHIVASLPPFFSLSASYAGLKPLAWTYSTND